MSEVRTTCPYCGVGCGVIANRNAAGKVVIRGDPDHPANRGRLCSKGSALADTLALDSRLLQPRLNGVDTDWDTALDAAAAGFKRVIEQHGPDAVAFYVSGQMLTEDYYVANKLMKGCIGSGNIDTNSRLCMSSAVAAHKRAFGEDLVPTGYEDVEQADLVVLVGSNLAWCHPVLYQRLIKARELRPHMRLVIIDPRRTPTCDLADLHLPLRAGTDVWLFNGLLSWLERHGHADQAFVQAHTKDAARALVAAHNTAGDVTAVARRCGVEAAQLQQFYEWFGATPRVVSLFSMGVNQSSCGTDKANAIINAHLLTGRIGQPGTGPFSITGQPNAMGGREVGGLANTLAAHMEFGNPEHHAIVQRFWNAPNLARRPGLKAVDLFEAIHKGTIRAVWIMATNPVVSLPNADRAREALARCEWVVVSDCVANTDTAALAHVLLPAAGWSEKDGTVTNSERVISRQCQFLPLSGQARPDWWIIGEVAHRLGFAEQFPYTSAAEIFDEHARLSTECNAGSRAFDIGGLAGLSPAQYAQLAPVRWPLPCRKPESDSPRLFSDGRFLHPDGRARLIAVTPRSPKFATDEEFPLVLNSGRIRDQWHTMTRTGLAARLNAHLPEPFVDMHAADALRHGLKDNTLVRVVTRWGRLVARLRVSGEIARGSVFVPIHWSNANASDARVGALVNPVVDAISGEPEFKSTPARVEPFTVNWYGFILTRHALDLQSVTWWARSEVESCQRIELAGRGVPRDWSKWARELLQVEAGADYLDYADAHSGTYRAVHIGADGLESCLFIGPQPQLPSRGWLSCLFGTGPLKPADRAGLLSGRPADPAAAADAPTVCACFSVKQNHIVDAIAQGCRTPADIGQRIKAGTNCGSCVPELRRLIAATPQAPAA